MAATISQISKASLAFFKKSLDEDFIKTSDLAAYGERDLQLLFGMFMSGWFGHGVKREIHQKITNINSGRLDFKIDKIGVELAVRKNGSGEYHLKDGSNNSEIAKLLKYKGYAVLILLDYGKIRASIDRQDYEGYKIVGKGNHKPSNFSVIHIYLDGDKPDSTRYNIKAITNG